MKSNATWHAGHPQTRLTASGAPGRPFQPALTAPLCLRRDEFRLLLMHVEVSSIVSNANLHKLLQTGTKCVRLHLIDPNLKPPSRRPTCRQSHQPLRLSISLFNQFIEFCFVDKPCGQGTQCFIFSSPRAQKNQFSDNILNFLEK